MGITKGSTVAYAGPCVTDNTINRPIVGYVTVCFPKFSQDQRFSKRITTVVHEMMHVLAFTTALFPLWEKPGGGKYSNNEMFYIMEDQELEQYNPFCAIGNNVCESKTLLK